VLHKDFQRADDQIKNVNDNHMACKIEIKQNLTDEISKKAEGLKGSRLEIAQKTAKEINKSYQFNVVKVFEGENEYTNKVIINIPEELINKYYDYFTSLEEQEARNIQREDSDRTGEEYTDDYLFEQSGEQQMSPASTKLLKNLKELVKKMGISLQTVDEYVKKHPEINLSGVNAVSDVFRKIIAIAEGKEDVALTEEIVHIATAGIEQVNPKMITEMIAKIADFDIYNATLKEYRNNKNYQLPDGRPDIRKIKKEAVDKLIAEVIVYDNGKSIKFPELENEGVLSMIRSWWKNIIDWFGREAKKADKELVEKFGPDISIFVEAAKEVVKGVEINTEQSPSSEGVYFQLSNAQKEFQKKILETNDRLKKVETKEKSENTLVDETDVNNWYEVLKDGEWRKVKRRVTDRTKELYNQIFKDKKFSPEEKAFHKLLRDGGIKYHDYFKEIHNRYFDTKDGSRRTTVSERPFIADPVDRSIYSELEKYFTELVDSFSKDGKTPLVFSEVMIYDAKRDEAGTIDLLIVDEDGKANIFDWKFMNAKADAEDIAWYKIGAYNLQLGGYKDILREAYGVKEIGRNRAIPILFQLKYKQKEVLPKITGINVGSVDVSKIKDLKLVPVSEKTETTGSKGLDEILVKLNAVYSQIGKEKATNEEEREFKSKRLNLIKHAIRLAQTKQNIAPLIAVIKEININGQMIISDYNTTYKDKDFKSAEFNNRQLSEFADEMREYLSIADVFGSITEYIGKEIYTPEMERSAITAEEKAELAEAKDVLLAIIYEQEAIRTSLKEIKTLSGEFADRFIGQRNLVTELLSAEAVVKGIFSTFRGVSEIPLASLNILYKLVTNARGRASRDAFGEISELMDIRQRLAKRGNLREIVKEIYQKDDNNKFVNKLIRRYNKEFYKGVDENAREDQQSKEWLKDNVDMEAYKQEAFKIMNDNISHISRKYETRDKDLMDKLILEEKQKWDVTRPDFTGWNNYVIKRHPLPKWESEDYKKIKNDQDLFALYSLVNKINEKAKEVGYIENKVASTFLPFIRKSMAESLAWDFGLSAIQNFGQELTINASTVGYGSVNELTGQLEHGLPKYYTYDFTKTEGGENDYSDVSEDLFKNMILYINHVEKYKYLSEVEGQLKLVKDVETFKNHLRTSTFGNVVFKDGKPEEESGNEDNTKMFDKFLRGVFYEQKYPLSDSDTPISIGVTNYIKKAINKVAKKEIFKDTDKPSAISMMKSMDMLNTGFQLKTLGFELISGAVNLFGVSIQIATQAGNYFKAREIVENGTKLIGNRFINNDEREMFVQLVDMFMPLKDDPSYEMLRKAGMTSLTRANFSDALMVFMRHPEQHVEKTIFLTLLDNMMMENGKIVSIREYVKNKHKDRFKSSLDYRESKTAIENEINELKETRSITATKKLENGKLVIPGLNLNDHNELQRLTKLTRFIARNATGGLSDADRTMASMNIWLKSMTVFKSWIPKLLSTRFMALEKVSDDFSVEIDENGMTTGEKYDIGRVRLWWYVLGTSIRDKSLNLRNIITMNEQGVIALDKMYEDMATKYRERTGKEFKMTEEDFKDLIRNNLRNQVKEFSILISLFGATLAMGMMEPPEDADKATKNFYRWSQKVVDRFVGELSFFYNPVEFQKMLGGSMFPAIGLINDIEKFSMHFIMQTTGLDVSDLSLTPDEVREKAMPIKYGAKMLPVTKAMLTWGSIFSSDFAEEFDITIQKNNLR